jgi:vacuolar-type H+-ATPase subunit I/STV1
MDATLAYPGPEVSPETDFIEGNNCDIYTTPFSLIYNLIQAYNQLENISNYELGVFLVGNVVRDLTIFINLL